MKKPKHHKGVSFNKKTQMWHAYLDRRGEHRLYLGLWQKHEEAVHRVEEAKRKSEATFYA